MKGSDLDIELQCFLRCKQMEELWFQRYPIDRVFVQYIQPSGPIICMNHIIHQGIAKGA